MSGGAAADLSKTKAAFMRPALLCALGLIICLCPARDARGEDLAAAAAHSSGGATERNDELWLISTRHCPCDGWHVPDAASLDVRRQMADGQWQDASLAEFLADDSRWTAVYVHGNRVSWYDAFQLGRRAHHALLYCGAELPPMRFVIWSWPSEQVQGVMRDVREKADRADREATCFGWFLSQLPPRSPVSLYGYSYGARVVSGGLHLLAGGMFNGITIAPPAQIPPLRAVYLAPAFDHCWVCEGSCHGQSLAVLEKLLILYNSCDPVLSRFELSDRCTRPKALGHVGISPACLGGAAPRVEQIDVCCYVGKTHQEESYWWNGCLLREICRVSPRQADAPESP